MTAPRLVIEAALEFRYFAKCGRFDEPTRLKLMQAQRQAAMAYESVTRLREQLDKEDQEVAEIDAWLRENGVDPEAISRDKAQRFGE